MSDVALRFGATDDGLTAQFRKVNQQLEQFEKSASKTADTIGAGFANLKNLVGAVSFVALTKEAFDLAESLEVASARTGIAVENLQRLQFVASQSNVSVDSVTAAINRLQKELVTGGEKASAAIRGMGLSIAELINLAPDQQFERVAEAIAEIQDPAERATTAIQVFGKGGADLLPLLRKGAEGVSELSARFDELGITLSEETVAKVDEAGDAVGRLGGAVKALGVELLSLVATPITASADGIITFIKAIRYGLTGGDDAERLNNRILELQGRVALFEKDRSQSGEQRLRQAREELEILTRQQQILLGLGEHGVELRLHQFKEIDLPAPKASFEAGPRELTPQELRTKSDGGPSAYDLQIDENKLLEDLNQQHLDELLRQHTEYVSERVHIESDGERFLADVRETFGLEQIEFEKMKNTSLIQIGSMLFTSLAAQNSKLAKIQQAIAIAETVYSTAKGIAAAVASLNWGAAAKIALVGAVQIAKIKSTNYSSSGVSGGSAPTVSGGDSVPNREASTGAVSAPEGAEQRPQANITIYSTGWSREAIQTFVDAARETFDNYDVTLFSPQSLQAQIIREG